MHVNNVGKPSFGPVTFKEMYKLTVVRKPMYVSSVEKLLGHPITAKNMNDVTLEQNVMHVNNVGMPSIGSVTLKICKNSVVRKPMYVSSVEKLSAFPVTSKHMKELTLETSPLHVRNVKEPLVYTVT
jgi:hypothetical protein